MERIIFDTANGKDKTIVSIIYDNMLFESYDITGMLVPVICNHCGKVYDLCDGKTIHRYEDCTVFNTPCCQTMVDDREYKLIPDFKRIKY